MEPETKEVSTAEQGTQKKEHSQKTWEKVVNIISIVLCVLAVIVAINGLIAKNRGYNNFFGKATYAVESDSMKGDKADDFKRGDLIFVTLLNDAQKQQLEVGNVITFWDMNENGTKFLNTHRIVAINKTDDVIVSFVTKGDNNDVEDSRHRSVADVIGKYSSKWAGVGNVVLFAQSQWGMFVLVVVPTILVLGYAIFEFVVSYKGFSKEKKASDKEALKAELRAEMAKENVDANQNVETLPKDTETKAEVPQQKVVEQGENVKEVEPSEQPNVEKSTEQKPVQKKMASKKQTKKAKAKKQTNKK